MHTVSLTFHGKQHQLSAPSSWAEATPAQLSAWITVLHTNLPDSEKERLAVSIFFDLSKKLDKSLPEHYRIQFAPLLRFIVGENDLSNWLIPTVGKLHGPADKLSNITAHEFFAYCEPLYWQHRQNPAAGSINALIAALYRSKRQGTVYNDVREALTDAWIAKQAPRVAKWSIALKMSILFNYEGCRNFITAMHPKAFSGKGGQSKKRGDVTLTLAGGPLGDLEKTRQTNIYDFLLHLEQMIEREEELQKHT